MASDGKRPYEDSYLIEYSREHVSYEFQMFLGLAAARETATLEHNSPALGTWIKNAVLEAVVLHLRNLLEFLYSDDPRPTDVVASDFYTDPPWNAVRPAITDDLKHARWRANKEMAHLSTSRLDPSDKEKEWDIPKLRKQLFPVLRAFVKGASPDRLDPAVGETLVLGGSKSPGS